MIIALPEPTVVITPPALDKIPIQTPTQAKTAAGVFKVWRFLLSGGRREGVEMLVVDSGSVRAALLPTRGLSLWRANIDGLDCGWKSPVDGPIHPQWVPLSEPSGLGWLDGFDELLVRCGLRNFGAPDFSPSGQVAYPLHGRIGNLPAADVVVDVDVEHSLLHVRGQVCESRFLQFDLRMNVQYSFAFGQPTIEVTDRVRNASANPGAIQMLYHINIGQPILSEGSQLHLPVKRIVARNARAAEGLKQWHLYDAPKASYTEQVYFSASVGDSQGWSSTFLATKSGDKGFAVHYNTATLPYFSQWKNTVAEADGYVTGIEPGTGFPNPRSFEQSQGRVVAITGGAETMFNLKLEGVTKPDRARQLVAAIGQLRGGQDAALAESDPRWCAPAK